MSDLLHDPIQHAALLLLLARRDPTERLDRLPDGFAPADEPAAYELQRRIMAALGEIGGWKVGAAGPDAPIVCGPMPLDGMTASGAPLPGVAHQAPLLVEAEVAFRITANLPPRTEPYSRDEVVAAIGSAHPAIEWLQSRFLDPDAVDALSNLADTQMHGGFVYGPGAEAWHGLAFADLGVTQAVGDGEPVSRVGNPAGDMLRLVQWLANVGAVWAGGLRAGEFVTCGSWTGKTVVPSGERATVRFAELGEVTLQVP